VAGAITVSALVPVCGYDSDRFWFPVSNLSAFWSQFQAGLSASERVFALMDVETAVRQTGSVKPQNLRGEIVFDHVSFRYSSAGTGAQRLQPAHPAGRKHCPGRPHRRGQVEHHQAHRPLYEFQEGEICIDGEDIRGLT
jgi:ATP-binding cassette subfamily B protein